MADALQGQSSFLRATAQRAGSLVLWAPRRAVNSLPPLPEGVRVWVPSFSLGEAASLQQQPTAGGITAASASSASPSPSPAGLITFPSPITFLTSSYLFTSLLLAFLLHRIHHIVPPRTRTALSRTPDSALRRVLSPAVQVGCRAPGMLLMLKSASGLAIALALSSGHELNWLKQGGEPNWVRWGVKGGAKALVWATAWAGKGTLGRFLAVKAMKSTVEINHPSLLWQTFLAIALSLSCETFVRALSDDLPSVHHFNLLSFSFLLHVHSASTSGGKKNAGAGQGSGDEELYIYLLLTLFELLTLQTSYSLPFLFPASYATPSTRRRTPSAARARPYRLPITAFFSLLSQFFAIRSWVRLFTASPIISNGGGGAVAGSRRADLEIFSTIWLNKVPEVCFQVIVGVSLGLKLLAALIRGEEMTVDNIVGHPSSAPSREEDYAVALIKYTTHLLSTTRLSGLALEISPLEVLPLSLSTPLSSLGLLPPHAHSHMHLSDAELEAMQARELEALGGTGTGVVLRGNGEVWFDEPVPVSELRHRSVGGAAREEEQERTREPDGFAHEIRRITVEDRSNPFPSSEGEVDLAAHLGGGGVGGGPLSMIQLEGQRKHVLWRFIALVARIGLYVAWRAVRAVKGAFRGLWRRARGRQDEGRLERDWWASGNGRRERERTPRSGATSPAATELWAEEDEEGDEDFSPDGEEEEEDWTSGSEAEEEEDAYSSFSAVEEGRDDADADVETDDLPTALTLYSDLRYPPSSPAATRRPPLPERPSTDLIPYSPSPNAATADELAPYLLAHQLTSGGMLTRRRYRALLPSSSSSPAPPSHCDHSRTASASATEATSSAISSRRRDVLSSALASHEAEGGGEGGVEGWMEQKREEWREGRSRFCVVCTVEERSVVLWPCRCLCLCDPCRSALADRTSSSSLDDSGAGAGAGGAGQQSGGGICPTCRTPVVGFSRIYVP